MRINRFYTRCTTFVVRQERLIAINEYRGCKSTLQRSNSKSRLIRFCSGNMMSITRDRLTTSLWTNSYVTPSLLKP